MIRTWFLKTPTGQCLLSIVFHLCFSSPVYASSQEDGQAKQLNSLRPTSFGLSSQPKEMIVNKLDQQSLELAGLSTLRFSLELLHQQFKSTRLSQNPSNLILSGSSLRQALTALALGAPPHSSTHQEILTTLQMPAFAGQALEPNYTYASQQISTNVLTLSQHNAMFIDHGFPLLTEYHALINRLNGDVHSLDMSDPASRLLVNSWISQKTKKLPPSLLAEQDFSQATMILINATYFKGHWLFPFEAQNTKPKNFIGFTDESTCQMMHSEDGYNLYQEPSMGSIIELPYKFTNTQHDQTPASHFSMYAALPAGNTATELFQATKLLELALKKPNRLKSTHTALGLPKFSVTSKHNLEKGLQELGIKAAFAQETADFSLISQQMGLHISKVIQQAHLQVDEVGSEAAAASAIICLEGCGPYQKPKAKLIFNRPFLMMIVDKTRKIPLFTAAILKP